jgi:hypothetical protein
MHWLDLSLAVVRDVAMVFCFLGVFCGKDMQTKFLFAFLFLVLK